VSLSLAMLTAGGIFARTAVGAASTNPGYSYDRSLLAELETRLAGLDGDRARITYDEVLARVRAWPGMRAASVASSVPYGETVESAWFEEAGSSDGRREPVTARAYRTIGADYFASLGLPMLRGREFTRVEESSASAPPVAIVDEMFARSLFEGRDPIGRTIRLAAPPGNASATSSEPLEIVGVAAPLREELLDRAPVPHVYVPFGRHRRTSMFLTARIEPGASEQAALEGIRTAVRSVDARLPLLTLATSTAFHNASPSLWALQASAAVFVSLGLLAMLVAGIGLYGVKSYVVAQRTPEIGLRMALGASGRDVLRLVLRDGAVLTGLGVAIGVPLAILVSVSFTKVFVEIGGIDATVIAAATVVLTAAAMLATLIPARRASRVQPLTALRHE
jgi:predicted permease